MALAVISEVTLTTLTQRRRLQHSFSGNIRADPDTIDLEEKLEKRAKT